MHAVTWQTSKPTAGKCKAQILCAFIACIACIDHVAVERREVEAGKVNEDLSRATCRSHSPSRFKLFPETKISIKQVSGGPQPPEALNLAEVLPNTKL